MFLRQCSDGAQCELVVQGGLQAGGREAEHRRLKVLAAVAAGGEIAGEEGGRLRGAGGDRLGRGGVGRRCGQHLRLELLQLVHEAEVGRDDAAPLLDDVKGGLQPQPLRPHDVGHADGGRARDARLAVHQHLAPRLLHLIWSRRRKTARC